MRCGILTPVVRPMPDDAAWETEAGPDEIGAVAVAADRLGYHHLTCAEHVAVPEGSRLGSGGPRGTIYWDPLATLAFVAARTERIRLVTHVLVLGYHHPLAIAKRYGTLDVLSRGRVVLGVGVGSLAEEFALLDADFDDRGARADDAIAALRASLGVRAPSYAGAYHRFDGFVIEPHAVQARMPIWVGGRSRRAARRAVALGDGWVPTNLPLADIAETLTRLEAPAGFEVALDTPPLDPSADPDATAAAMADLAGAGATVVNAAFAHRSAAHYLEQLDALRALPLPDVEWGHVAPR